MRKMINSQSWPVFIQGVNILLQDFNSRLFLEFPDAYQSFVTKENWIHITSEIKSLSPKHLLNILSLMRIFEDLKKIINEQNFLVIVELTFHSEILSLRGKGRFNIVTFWHKLSKNESLCEFLLQADPKTFRDTCILAFLKDPNLQIPIFFQNPVRFPHFMKVVRSISNNNIGYFFDGTLPSIENSINEKNYIDILNSLTEIYAIFHIQINLRVPLFFQNPIRLPYFMKIAVDMSHSLTPITYYALPSLEHIISEENYVDVLNSLVKLHQELGEGSDFIFGNILPHVKLAITKKNWPLFAQLLLRICKDLGENHGFDIKNLFNHLPFIEAFKEHKHMSEIQILVEILGPGSFIINELPKLKKLMGKDFLPEIVDGARRMEEIVGDDVSEIFIKAIVQMMGMINKNSWPTIIDGLLKMTRSLKGYYIAFYRIVLPNNIKFIDLQNWDQVVKELPKLIKAAGKNVNKVFNFKENYITKENWLTFYSKLILVAKDCPGAENETYDSLNSLKRLFDKFGLELFDSLIFPTLKRQKVAAFLCFHQYGKLTGSIQGEEDFKLLITILSKRGYKAADFLNHILFKGTRKGVIATPLSLEKKYLIAFMKDSPVDLLSVYISFKKIMSSDDPQKVEQVELLFKEVKDIKKDIAKIKTLIREKENLVASKHETVKKDEK